MQRLEINTHLFNRLFPEALRREIEQQVACALLWGDPDRLPEANLEYFAHLSTYAGRAKDLPQGIRRFNDMFPPNFAVLDYVVKYLQPENERILDFACGLGGLVMYLRMFGYCAFGFDQWTQISERMARRFLGHYLENGWPEWIMSSLDEPRGSEPLNPTTLVFVGGHWEWITPEDKKALFTPALRCILVDSSYSPRAIKGFELTSYYQGLLHVFERCGE